MFSKLLPKEGSIWLFAFAAVITLAFRQDPLFELNQNSYFVVGIANADQGNLRHDYLADISDPFPVFSLFVEFVYRSDLVGLFYLSYWALVWVWLVSLLGIVKEIFSWDYKECRFLLFSITYAGLLSGIFYEMFDGEVPVNIFGENSIFSTGVAGQELISGYLQPSSFGVLLSLSIYLLLLERNRSAVVCLAIVPWVHFSYLMPSLLIFSAFLFREYIQGSRMGIRENLVTVGFYIVTILALVIYVYSNFYESDPYIRDVGARLLIDYRMPHHAKPSVWFGLLDFIQLVLISLSIVLVFLMKKTFVILWFPFLGAVLISILGAFLGAKAFSLLFPWRISAVLVPIAGAISVAFGIRCIYEYAIKYLAKEYCRLVAFGLVVFFTVFSIFGLSLDIDRMLTKAKQGSRVLLDLQSIDDDILLLIPPDEFEVRLKTLQPVFVDFKSHPYAAGEVITWYQRLLIAKEIYRSPTSECSQMLVLLSGLGITHVIDTQEYVFPACQWAVVSSKDDEYRLITISN